MRERFNLVNAKNMLMILIKVSKLLVALQFLGLFLPESECIFPFVKRLRSVPFN
jgi:hypothetical protein